VVVCRCHDARRHLSHRRLPGVRPKTSPIGWHRKTGSVQRLRFESSFAGNRVRCRRRDPRHSPDRQHDGKKITSRPVPPTAGHRGTGELAREIRFRSPGIACNPSVQLKAGRIASRHHLDAYMACTQKSHPTVQLPLCTSSGNAAPSSAARHQDITVGLPARNPTAFTDPSDAAAPSAQRLRICRTAHSESDLSVRCSDGNRGLYAELTNTSSRHARSTAIRESCCATTAAERSCASCGCSRDGAPDPASPTLVTVTAGGKAQFRFAASDVLANANNGPEHRARHRARPSSTHRQLVTARGPRELWLVRPWGSSAVTRLGVGP